MAGIAVAFFLLPLWQASNTSSLRRYRLIVSASAIFIVVAVTLYLSRGEPESVSAMVTSSMTQSAPHAVGAASNNGTTTAGSMEQAAVRLAQRLRDGNASDDDWKLLQQSYEFLGDTEGATLAQQHRVKSDLTVTEAPAAEPVDATLASRLAPFQQRVSSNPKDSEAWLAIAELNRTARNYAPANAAYEHVISLKKMTAGSWADYADSVASQSNSLNNPQTVRALDAALKLDPDQLKALWLKASLMHETGKYQEALTGWQKLASLVSKDSSDYKLIEDNINEARMLANGKSVSANPVTPPSAVSIAGRVDVDASVKSKVGTDMMLFVFAKPVDSPGPPAAVLRVPVKSWPVSFLLDDSLSMIPTRKLSQFKSVNVQARLSRSGQALPQAGDIQSEVTLADTQANKPLVLKLSKVVE